MTLGADVLTGQRKVRSEHRGFPSEATASNSSSHTSISTHTNAYKQDFLDSSGV